MGDGILDAAGPCRGEFGKPMEASRDALIARYKSATRRTVDALEADLLSSAADVGTIAAACALGYLDFRYAAALGGRTLQRNMARAAGVSKSCTGPLDSRGTRN